MKFYLAGAYNARLELAAAAEAIERVSGWRCTSRWLTGEHNEAEPPDGSGGDHQGAALRKAANDDVADVREAQALVLDASLDSTRGGMWIEFGIALERRMPIVVVSTSGRAGLPVFAYLPSIWWVGDHIAAGRELGLIEKYRMAGVPSGH